MMNACIMVLAIMSLAAGISYIADASAQTPTGAVDDPGITSNSVHIAVIDVLANDVSGATITGVTQPTSPKGHISAIGASHGTTSHNGSHVTWTPDPWSSPDRYPYVRHIPVTFNYTITASGASDTAKVSLNITRGTATPTSTATVSYERAYHPDAVRDSFAVDTLETVVLDVLANDSVHATDAAGDTLTIAGTDKLRAVLASGYYSRDPNFAGTISHNDTHITYTPSTNVTARPTIYTVIFEYSVTDGKNIAKALAEIAVDTTIVNNRVDDTVIDILNFHGPSALHNGELRTIESLEFVTPVETGRVGELSHNGTHITFTPSDRINGPPYPVPNNAELVFRYALSAQEGITRTATPDYDDLRMQENGTLLVAIAEEEARIAAASGSRTVEVTIILREESDFAVFGDTVRSPYRDGSHRHTLDVLSNDILPDGATITSVSPLRLNSYLTQDQIAQWLSQNTSRVCADDVGADGSIGIKCDNLAEITQRQSLGSLGIAADGRSITYTEAGPYRVSSGPSDDPVNIEIPNLYTSTTLQYPLAFNYTVTAGSEVRTGTVWLVDGEPLSDADSPLVAVDDDVSITPARNQTKFPSARIFVMNNDRAEGATFTIVDHPGHGSVAIREGHAATACEVELDLDLTFPENGSLTVDLTESLGRCAADKTESERYSPASVVYTADAWYSGADSFTYALTRGGIESHIATVRIDIADTEHPVQIDESSIPRDGVHIVPIRHNATDRVDPKHPNATATWGDFRNVHGYIPVAEYNITHYDDRVVVGLDQGTYAFAVRATDHDGTPITFGLEGETAGMSIDPSTGVFTWDPTDTQLGLHDFEVTASSGVDTARATVKIQVVAENYIRPPGPPLDTVAVPDTAYTRPGDSVLIDVLGNDGVEFGRNGTITGVTQPQNGNAAVEDSMVRYTPDAGHTGSDTFEYTLSDGTDTRTAVVTVIISDSVHAADDEADIVQDRPAIIDVLANDGNGAGATVTIVGQAGRGTAEALSDGTIRYTPDRGHTGPDRFTYSAGRASGDADEAVVTINVTSIDDEAFTTRDMPVTINVLDNDLLGDATTIRLLDQPLHGSVYVWRDGIVLYTPDSGYTGTDTFRYVARDNTPPTGVTLLPHNDWARVRQDTPTIINVLSNDEISPAGTPVRIAFDNFPSRGEAVVSGNAILYTPHKGVHTISDDIGYTISAGGVTEYATVGIWIYRPDAAEAIGAPPTASRSGVSVNPSGSVTVDLAADNHISDAQQAADTLAVRIEPTPTQKQGMASVTGTAITYTANADAIGYDTIAYRVTDNDGLTTTGAILVTITTTTTAGTVTVTVAEPLAAPDISAHTAADTAVRVRIIDDPDRMRLAVIDGPANGSLKGQSGLAILEDGTDITYTPDDGFVGTDSLQYRLVRGNELTGYGTITISVGAADDTAQTTEGQAVTIPVLANDGTTGYSLDAVSDPRRGKAVISGSQILYTPREGFVGTDVFTYNTSGPGGTPVITPTVTVEVLRIAVDDSATVSANSDDGIRIDVLANDNIGDLEGAEVLNRATISDPTNGMAAINGSQILYTPNTDFSGIDTFTYTINHTDTPRGNETRVTATVTVTVTPVFSPLDFGLPRYDSRPFLSPHGTFESGIIPAGVRSAFDARVTENADDIPYRFELDRAAVPAGATITPRGDFSWTPSAAQAGEHAIQVRLVPLIDDLAPVNKTLNLCVTEPPAISEIGDIEIFAGQTASLNVTVDSSCPVMPPTLSLVGAPDGATFEPIGGAQQYVEVGAGQNLTYRLEIGGFEWVTAPSNRAENHTVTIGVGDANRTFVITVRPSNEAPEFTAPYRFYTLEAGEEFYSVPFRDARFLSDDSHALNPNLVYSASDDKPAGLTVTAHNGTIRWTPTADDAGRHEFNFTVSDGQYADTMRVIIFVLPALSASDDTVGTATDAPVIIRPLENDNGETVIVNYTSPANGTIQIFDKTFLYTPKSGFSGTDTFEYTVEYQYLPEAGNITATVRVTVSDTATNQAPEITAIDDQTISEGSLLEFDVIANDPDGDDFEYVLLAAPHNAELNASSGAFAWTPTEVQDGPHVITIGAIDSDSATATMDVNVNVTEVNVPTSNFRAENTTAELGLLLEHPVRATDPDQTRIVTEDRSRIIPQVTFGLAGDIPDGAEIDSVAFVNGLNTANVEWTPNMTGTYTFNVTVTDGSTILSQEITITVSDTLAPEIKLNGSDPLLVELTDPYTDPGARVTDNDPAYDGTVTATPSTIDTSVIANHTVTYSAPADAAGNAPESVTRTVQIVLLSDRPPVAPSFGNATDEDTPITITPPISDPNPGDTPVITGVTNGSIGGTTHDNTTITYMPHDDAHGPDMINYTVTDDAGLVATGTINITVTPVNDNPVLDPGMILSDIMINAERSYNITAEADDVDGDTLTFSLTGEVPENATIDSASGLFEWTPRAPGQLGNHTVTITVTDGQGGADSKSIVITVLGSDVEINNPPRLRAIGDRNVDEGETLEIRPIATDPEGDPLTYSLTRGTLPATAVFNETSGYLDWTPGEEDGGISHDITITVSDGQRTDSENITITVIETNQNPMFVSVPVQIATVGETLIITLGATDADSPTQALKYDITSSDDLGATISGNILSWTPTSAHAGSQSLAVRVQDDFSPPGSDTITISFVVRGEDTPPTVATLVANNDEAPVRQDMPSLIQVLSNDVIFPAGTPVNITVINSGSRGDAVPSGSAILYTPNQGATGSDTVTYTISAGNVTSNTATVSIEISDAATTPAVTLVANNDETTARQASTVSILVLANDNISPAGTPVEIAVINPGSRGNAVAAGSAISYTADHDAAGTDTITYTISAGGVTSNVATVSVRIYPADTTPPPNAPPMTSNFGISVNPSGSVTVDLAAQNYISDAQQAADTLAVRIERNPPQTQGMASATGTTITYTASAGATGSDTIAYRVTDNTGLTSTGTIQVTITTMTPTVALTANNDIAPVRQDTPSLIQVLSNDVIFPAGTPVNITVINSGSRGDAVENGSAILYTPNQGATGSDTVSYTISAGNVTSNTAAVSIEISDTPATLPAVTLVANNDEARAGQNSTVSILVLANDNISPVGTPVDITVINSGSSGDAVAAGSAISYTADDDAAGTDTVSYTISAGNVTSNTATVSIRIDPAGTILPPNTAPTASNFGIAVNPSESVTVDLAGQNRISDDQQAAGTLAVRIERSPPQTQGMAGATGTTITYAADAGATGSDAISYTVTDNGGLATTGTIQVTITPPVTLVANDDDAPVQQDVPSLIQVLSNDVITPAGTPVSITVINSGSNGNAVASGSAIMYTPNQGVTGTDTVTYTISAGNVTSNVATVSIRITTTGTTPQPNTAPSASDFGITVNPSGSITVDLAARNHISDDQQAADTLAVRINDNPPQTQGMAGATGTTITYAADAGATGSDTISYTVTDNGGLTATGTITVTVTTQPITVTAVDDTDMVNEGATVTIDVLGNDVISPANIPQSALEITSLDRASHGQATTDGNTVTYTPDTFGTDPTLTRTETLEYTVMVQGGNSDTATITITINNVNLPPVAQDSSSFVAVNSTNVMIPLSVSDPDGDDVTITSVTGATLGTATHSGTTITYTPRANVTGTDMITYTVTDGELSSTGTITIIIVAFGGGSDSGNDWRKAPTFGRSFNTDELIVSCGYSMDGQCRDVTDYHVDYERETIETGSTHDFTLRAYGVQTLEMFQLGFGMPQIGSPLNTAEALIEITVSPNYDPDSSGYDVTDIVYRNPNNVIDEDATITARDIACQPGSELVCVQIDIRGVTFREQMYHEPFGIFVMDTDRRSSTFYMNEGLLVEGESLNPAPTATKSTKSGNQAETLVLTLTRTDKLSNIWTDQIGNRWTQNEYGTWLLIYAVPKSFATACTDENNRYCDAFQTRLDVHHDTLEDIRDDRYGDIYTTPAYDDLTEAITILDMDGDSRTAFLEQNNMMWVRQGN